MDKIETDFFQNLTKYKFSMVSLHHYIDDVFIIWTHGLQKLKSFLEDLNSYYPNIKCTHESSKESISLQDLLVSFSDNRLLTDLYIKPTDRYQYLHYSFSHSDYTRKSIIYSQTLRFSRLCTKETEFMQHKNEMKSSFLKGGYLKSII